MNKKREERGREGKENHYSHGRINGLNIAFFNKDLPSLVAKVFHLPFCDKLAFVKGLNLPEDS